MPKQLIAIIKMGFTVVWVGLLAANLTANFCWGADQATAQTTITLDVKNEPLRSVLGKITKTTKWKIKAPDKWLDKPVTQTLNKVTLEEGLKSVLNNAGVENLLLMYDEYFKVVTIFDTESLPTPPADRSPQVKAPPPVQAQAPPPVQARSPIIAPPVINSNDPMLQRAGKDTGPAPARVNRRARRQSSADD